MLAVSSGHHQQSWRNGMQCVADPFFSVQHCMPMRELPRTCSKIDGSVSFLLMGDSKL